MCAWVDRSIVSWPFPGNGRRVYALALVALELKYSGSESSVYFKRLAEV